MNFLETADGSILRAHQRISNATTDWFDVDCLSLASGVLVLSIVMSMIFVTVNVSSWNGAFDYKGVSSIFGSAIVAIILSSFFWDRWKVLRRKIREKDECAAQGNLMSLPHVPNSIAAVRVIRLFVGIVFIPDGVMEAIHGTYVDTTSTFMFIGLFIGMASTDWFLLCMPRTRPPRRNTSKSQARGLGAMV